MLLCCSHALFFYNAWPLYVAVAVVVLAKVFVGWELQHLVGVLCVFLACVANNFLVVARVGSLDCEKIVLLCVFRMLC